MAEVTADHTPSDPTMSHLRLMRSATAPEKGLDNPYTHKNMAIKAPNASAFCRAVMSSAMFCCMVDSICRSR